MCSTKMLPTNRKFGVILFFQQPKLKPFEENKSSLFLCLLLTVVFDFIHQPQETKLSKRKLLLCHIYSSFIQSAAHVN